VSRKGVHHCVGLFHGDCISRNLAYKNTETSNCKPILHAIDAHTFFLPLVTSFKFGI
jgi:hypothetical protein